MERERENFSPNSLKPKQRSATLAMFAELKELKLFYSTSQLTQRESVTPLLKSNFQCGEHSPEL